MTSPTTSMARLKSFSKARADVERCGLCAAVVAESHAHVWNVERRTIACACMACTQLFVDGSGRYRSITPRAEALADFRLDDAIWHALAVPIGLCFFQRRGDDIVATYPSPGGATESIVPAETWVMLARANPALTALAEHTEALLVQRLASPSSYHLVSIDHAYALVGLVRRHWRGLGGGAELHEALARFFDRLGGARA